MGKTLLPLFSGDNLNITYIPINKSLQPVDSTLLPIKVGEKLIRESAHRVIINRCTCRDARQCENHPVDFGCTLLGEGTRAIDPRIARHVSVTEAIAHLHRTVENGLVPMAGRVKIDNYIWGVPDTGQLLTICHCCHCCCTILTSGKYLPEKAAASLVPLKGLIIETDSDRCVLCETCIENCHMRAIALKNERIVHLHHRCIGCGRCLTICPRKAVTASVKDIDDAVSELIGRIETRIDFKTDKAENMSC
jgi:UDP-glucose 4-epimerase